MVLGMMQPYFLPYLGYYALIRATDTWVVFDDTQYIRHGWVDRNRVLHPTEGWQYIKVPVVKIGDQVVWESAIINEFVDEMFPETPLMPADPFRKAQARIWIDYCNTRFVDDNYTLLAAKTEDEQAPLREKVIANLRYIESEGMAKLSDGPYWLGAEISLVDLTYYPFFERMVALKHYRGVAIPEDCTRIRGWLALMAERESTKTTMNDEAYYIERYARYAA